MSAREPISLVIVGAGRMGGAVLTGALKAGVLQAGQVGIWHSNAMRAVELAEKYGVATTVITDFSDQK